MNRWYALLDDGKTPYQLPGDGIDSLRSAPWNGSAYPDYGRVGLDYLNRDQPDEVMISTVFLKLDHSFCYGEPCTPVLWETMIFGLPGEEYQYQERYTSYDDALQGHHAAIQYAKFRLGQSVEWEELFG
jgi:hypothetical protein